MILFLLSFFLIYVIFHCYAYIKTRAVIPITGWRYLPACLFVLLMVTMPISTRLLEQSGFESTARITAYLGYIWMGFLFFFVSAALLMDMLGIVCVVTQLLLRFDVRWPFFKKIAFWLPALVALLACMYGVFEAGNIQIETVTLQTDKLPPGRDRMRIVQISDLHLGLIVRQHKLKQVVAKIKQVHPDLLVSTGDLVDGQLAKLNGLAEILQQLTPPYGKFAVTGNHEFYVGIRQSLDFTRKAGFQLLRGESVQIENWLTVAGLDDQMAVIMGLGDDEDGRLFDNVSSDTFVLLLKHRPTVDPHTTKHVNLQLSGHIHKGQIFPFNLLVHLVYPVPIGLSQPAEGYSLYV
ncbi:MAG: metallophosphoesterase, partial [Desulfovibrionaceae bacterium]|nr:metallophosphoesterase [Desulfovibrionaceae bacterium]